MDLSQLTIYHVGVLYYSSWNTLWAIFLWKYQAEIFKRRQYGTVSDYQANLEKNCNHILGLPLDVILDCFLSGPIPEIRRQLAIQKPTSIS